MIRDTVQEEALLALVSEGAVREFLVRRGPDGKGWTFAVRLGRRWISVRSRREPIRVWASLTAVGNYAERIGVRGFGVEL